MFHHPGMDDTDLCWLAGILEGEGCFQLKTYPGNKRLGPAITLGMTDRDVVARAGRLLGGQQRAPRMYYPANPKHKPKYIWRVSGGRAVGILWALLPLMGERRAAKIRSLLAEWVISGRSIPAWSRPSGERVAEKAHPGAKKPHAGLP